MKRGYFGIGVYHPKHEVNIGTLWRSATIFGASSIFTVGRRYKSQCADTCSTARHIPMQHFTDAEDLVAHLPHSCPLIGVELTDDARPLDRFVHPERAWYLLGAEDHGLPPAVLAACHHVVAIPHGRFCLNVAVAGSIVMYSRRCQQADKSEPALV